MRRLTVLALLATLASLLPGCTPHWPAPKVAEPETRIKSASLPRVEPEPIEPTLSPGLAQPLEPAASAEVFGAREPLASEGPAVGDTTFREPVVAREATVVRVLLYHGIGARSSRLALKLASFREQLDWMQEIGVEVIRLSQLLDFLDSKLLLPRHAAVITIDDGEANGYSAAFQVLRERELPFALGIATDAIQEHRRRGALSWGQIREMVESGLCEVASHSVTHRAMTSLPDEVARRELDGSRAILKQALGVEPDAFFYPLGASDRRVRHLTRGSGYRAAFVAQGAPTVAKTPRFAIPRYDVKPSTALGTFQSFFRHGIRVSGDDPEFR